MSHSKSGSTLESFRTEVREFLQHAIPEDVRAAVRANCLVTRDQAMRWQQILHARGWAAPGWPREHGGPGWSLVEQAVFREELAASDAPRYENLGIDTIGPTLIRHGTPGQKARFLPRMLSFEDFWAQGYSEPGAGSDLASLATQARRDGDAYVVNGTKIWQSYGHWANRALLLVRTDAHATRKQLGISVLLVDLNSPGVSVRPIRFMNGSLFHVQMFFDDVRVPLENLVGEEHQGWSVAKGLLVTERLFVARVAECRAELQKTVAIAAAHGRDGASLLDQDVLGRRHAALEIRGRALEAAWWPTVRAVQQGREPSLEASMLKLQGNELLQDIHQLQLDLVGADALACDPGAVDGVPSEHPLSEGHVNNLALHAWRYRGITLGGGTSEIQRDIVAKAVFGGLTELETPLSGLSQEQTMLDAGLRRLLADRYGFDRRRTTLASADGFDPQVWRAFADLGLAGLLMREDDGGFGGTVADAVPVLEALGESLVVEPLIWNSMLPARLLSDAEAWVERRSALGLLASGGLQVAFAHLETSGIVDPPCIQATARRDGHGWRLDGRKRMVLGGDRADRLIVSALGEDGRAMLFDCGSDAPGIRARRYRLHDGRGAADISFANLRVAGDALIAGHDDAAGLIDHALALATLMLCADSVGAMRRALAQTVEFMRTRRQFGRSLSEYQALQHRVVEHFRGWSNARALVREAAEGWHSGSAMQRALRVSAAKWATGQAGRSVALDVLQLHGAVGMQDETAVSHYARRLVANDALLGDSACHLGRFAAWRAQASSGATSERSAIH